MNSHITVSIIMPAYNCANYIAEAIGSVHAQSFEDWELWVIDDCSSDDTIKIVNLYTSDPRVKLIRNEVNLGGAGARNCGIEAARGRYIAFLDADDVWLQDKLMNQLAYMQKHSVALSYGDYGVMDESGATYRQVQTPASVSLPRMLKHNYIACLTATYDTHKVGKVYMPLIRKRQDFALWIEILKKCGKAHRAPGCLGHYRIRRGSLSDNKKDAFLYYWRVLREVAGCGVFEAAYNVTYYLIIVFCKKKLPLLYRWLMVHGA